MPGTCPLAEQAEPLYGDDTATTPSTNPSTNTSSPRPLQFAWDLVPQKQRADVLLVGTAYAPMGTSGRSFVARLAVDGLSKSVEQTGERRPDRSITCQGFSPIAPTAPSRAPLAGSSGAPFPPVGRAFVDQPIPTDLNRLYFNVAPVDQQVDELRMDARIVLDNMNAQHAQLVTSLPGLLPRVILDRGRGGEPIAMRPDTLWIDTDRQICTIVYRGQFWLTQRNEPGRIHVLCDEPAKIATPKASDPGVAAQNSNPTIPYPVSSSSLLQNDVIVELSDDELDADTASAQITTGEIHAVGAETMMIGPELLRRATMPFAVPTPAPAPQTPATPPMPAYVPLPVPPPQPQATPASPWALGNAVVPKPIVPPLPPEDPQVIAAFSAPPAAKAGVLAASNAAASAEPVVVKDAAPVETPAVKPKPSAENRGLGPKEALKFLYFDAPQVERVRQHKDWCILLAALSLRLLERGERDDESDESTKTRRDVFEVLLRGDAIAAEGIRAAYGAGITEDRRFEPPLVLVQGELELPFDELSVLKATVAAVRPLSAGDKRLTEVLDAVEELSKTPWLEGSSGIAAGLLDRVREAFGMAKRAVTWEYVESHTERMLLERRCYQTRTLWGKRWIRGVLRGGVGGDVPTYLPESLKDKLPMFKRFRVKLIAEVEAKEDQYEASAYALKVVGLGRIVPLM